MNKTYQAIIKALGVVALSMLIVAVILYVNDNRTNAEIAFGVFAIVGGVALIMHSLRF
ncbi:MAG: hypothetical protein Fur006_19130 [Coleofasciculaceae cyanobacterium]|jgi:hypothetical protein